MREGWRIWEGREVLDSNSLFSRTPEIVQSYKRGGVERSGEDRGASFLGEDRSHCGEERGRYR